RYSRVRTSELTVFGAARPPARFSTIFPQRWNATGELSIILSSVSIHAARYSPSLSLRRRTQALPARRTFFAPIERSARAWLTICVAVGQRPAWTISGRAHSVSVGVAASPSWALKQNLTPRCNRPPSAGPRQRRGLYNLAIFLHFCGDQRPPAEAQPVPGPPKGKKAAARWKWGRRRKLRGRWGNPAHCENQDDSAVEESPGHELLPLVAGHHSSIAAVSPITAVRVCSASTTAR